MVFLPMSASVLKVDDKKEAESDQPGRDGRCVNRASGDNERMTIVLIFLKFSPELYEAWTADWAWGIPMVLLTVALHVLGLGVISQRVIELCGPAEQRRHPIAAFALIMGTTTTLATFLHGIEAGLWALAYLMIGALPNFKTAMLYSLGAMTTYGHENLFLNGGWQLLGTIEALDGWLLFGLSTAVLFSALQEVSLHRRTRR